MHDQKVEFKLHLKQKKWGREGSQRSLEQSQLKGIFNKHPFNLLLVQKSTKILKIYQETN